MEIYKNKIFRKGILSLLKFFNPGRISIRHHYTGKRFSLDAFHHKGYWYHGKKREQATMGLFGKLIKPNDSVIEIGGHIGYITNYFSHLASNGQVYVFEPGINNLPYLEKNIQQLKNVTLVKKAVSDENGRAKFYIEDLTGQNNSLLSEYAPADSNTKFAFVKTSKKEVEVETITLDTFCDQFSIIPDFIKIDIEGAELLALKGMLATLRKHGPTVMMEITENWKSIYKIFTDEGYTLYNVKKAELKGDDEHWGNTFCINPNTHLWVN